MLPVNRRILVAMMVATVSLTGCDLGTTVEIVDVGRIEIQPSAEAVALGDEVELNATAFSDRGEQLSRSFEFSSSNTSVATVSNGVIRGQSPGEATITASVDGASATARVTVVDLPCDLSASNGSIHVGSSEPGDLTGACFFNAQAGNDENNRPREGRFIDFWLLVVESGGNIEIEMTSSAFDTYMILTDVSLTLIAQNDDIILNVERNSRIISNLEPGVYVIWASSAFAGEEGSYQLTVSS